MFYILPMLPMLHHSQMLYPPNALSFQCLPMFPPPNITLPSQIDLLMESIDPFFPTVTRVEPLYREQAVHGNCHYRSKVNNTYKGSKCHTIQVLVSVYKSGSHAQYKCQNRSQIWLLILYRSVHHAGSTKYLGRSFGSVFTCTFVHLQVCNIFERCLTLF